MMRELLQRAEKTFGAMTSKRLRIKRPHILFQDSSLVSRRLHPSVCDAISNAWQVNMRIGEENITKPYRLPVVLLGAWGYCLDG